MELTDNINITQFKSLITPKQLKDEQPQTEAVAQQVADFRFQVQNILTHTDKRRLIITGPCSLHDEQASLDYAGRLKQLQETLKDKILIIMRTYFEKPRTTLGWKGMIYDPYLDGSYDIEAGLRRARSLLLAIGNLGVPTATEFLDTIIPQYLADLVSWAAIGARTTESQIHRQMASGLSMPIGFKNSTDGNLYVAIDAVKAAGSPHSFLGIDRNGKVIIAETRGNKYGHLVLRGGANGPNYGSEYCAFAQVLLQKADVATGIMIDCSHANSSKNHTLQRHVLLDVTEQIRHGNSIIAGIMLESFLKEGSQPCNTPDKLNYGQSITDGCIGWEETEELIRHLANS
ncbi:MAG: 3-deoxy-7-phosphoheptulonate synthase [Sedimentisphaerales bacterium]|nr:3-deoxy-7-phosphoheptulonate synthase [Sedimentisphaerales bacterium]